MPDPPSLTKCSSIQIWDEQVLDPILVHIPEFCTYLGFSLSLNGVQTYLRYVVGCFGLANLPFLFTKIYRPLVAHWRSLSIPAIMFLDDGGFFEQDETSANPCHWKLRTSYDKIKSVLHSQYIFMV